MKDMSPDATISSNPLVSLLACAKCHHAVPMPAESVTCPSCGAVIQSKEGVLMTEVFSQKSYFDHVFEIMRASNRESGTWNLFYREQARLVGDSLRQGDVVVDVGCGPELPYAKNGAFVVGVDASYDSIRANNAVDLRVYASAAALPLRTASADAVICFYSVHHMTGNTVGENRRIVREVFREFHRVLRPTGRLLIFEVSPLWPFGIAEELSWNLARKWIGSGLDMYFWTRNRLVELGNNELQGATFSLRRFPGAPLQTFPPVFSWPSLRVPRFLYPFDICLYTWKLAPDRSQT